MSANGAGERRPVAFQGYRDPGREVRQTSTRRTRHVDGAGAVNAVARSEPPVSGVGQGRVRVIGPGRAGGAFARVLAELGFRILDPIVHGEDPARATADADLVVIATPDRAVAEVAAALEPRAETLVVHLAGSHGLDVLAGHPRRGALHPLVSIPDPATGAALLRHDAWFAVAAADAADAAVLDSIVAGLGGHRITVSDADRAAYHAAAAIASNHLVALFGQVTRIAHGIGLPLDAFLGLGAQTLAGVAELGPTRALTGPVARGDWDTVARHLDALDARERPGYAAMAELATRLVPGSPEPPAWLYAERGSAAPGDGASRERR